MDIEVSPQSRRLLKHCEAYCAAECCKAAAFDLHEEKIVAWFNIEMIDRSDAIMHELSVLREKPFEDCKEVFLKVRGLESTWRAQEFSEFLGELEQSARSALQQSK